MRSFTYLGSIFTVDGSLDEDIQHRIGRTRRAAAQLSALWRQHHVDLAVKILMCKAIIPPTLLYGAETWALSASQTRQLDTALHHVLRQVLGIRLIDRVTNSEIRERCGQQPDVAALTQQARLRFLGHIVRRKPDREGRQHSARVLLFATHTPKASGLPRRGGHSITDLLNQDLQGLGIMIHSRNGRVSVQCSVPVRSLTRTVRRFVSKISENSPGHRYSSASSASSIFSTLR